MCVCGEQVWDASIVNGDDLALTFSLADKDKDAHHPGMKANMQGLRLAPEQVAGRVYHGEDCSGGNCRFN